MRVRLRIAHACISNMRCFVGATQSTRSPHLPQICHQRAQARRRRNNQTRATRGAAGDARVVLANGHPGSRAQIHHTISSTRLASRRTWKTCHAHRHANADGKHVLGASNDFAVRIWSLKSQVSATPAVPCLLLAVGVPSVRNASPRPVRRSCSERVRAAKAGATAAHTILKRDTRPQRTRPTACTASRPVRAPPNPKQRAAQADRAAAAGTHAEHRLAPRAQKVSSSAPASARPRAPQPP